MTALARAILLSLAGIARLAACSNPAIPKARLAALIFLPQSNQ